MNRGWRKRRSAALRQKLKQNLIRRLYKDSRAVKIVCRIGKLWYTLSEQRAITRNHNVENARPIKGFSRLSFVFPAIHSHPYRHPEGVRLAKILINNSDAKPQTMMISELPTARNHESYTSGSNQLYAEMRNLSNPAELQFQDKAMDGHLPRWLAGEDRPPRSLATSSSISLPSKQWALLLTLCSELALLLVARGESKMLAVLLLVEPDLTLYMEEAENEVNIPYASKPYPGTSLTNFSQTQNYLEKTMTSLSCYGQIVGGHLLEHWNVTGLRQEQSFHCGEYYHLELFLLMESMIAALFDHLHMPQQKMIESLVLQGLDFTVGEAPRGSTGFFGGADLVTEEDLAGGGTELLSALDGVDGRLTGVADLDELLDAVKEGRAVGVDDLAAGTEGLTEGAAGFDEGIVALDGTEGLDVGVEGREVLAVACNVGRAVGVAGRDVAERDADETSPPDDEGRRAPTLDDVTPVDDIGCLLSVFPLEAVSVEGFASCTEHKAMEKHNIKT
ncbi:hypothetical protein ACLOJK_012384 [Asimina triloba]